MNPTGREIRHGVGRGARARGPMLSKPPPDHEVAEDGLVVFVACTCCAFDLVSRPGTPVAETTVQECDNHVLAAGTLLERQQATTPTFGFNLRLQ